MKGRTAIVAVAVLAFSAGGRAQTGGAAFVWASGFTTPLGFVQDPSDSAIQYVVEQGGRIRVLRNRTTVGDFLDISGDISAGGERGLLGLAFAPDYSSSRRFYVNFTNPSGDTVIARFLRSATNPLAADPSTRFDLRIGGSPAIPQPFANHNGGQIEFGPDGYLYIGMGDGGSGNDPDNHAQNPASLLGKMLRIDVNVALADPAGYRIPPDNPFVASGPAGTRPEIWSFGLRNPWRFSFDRAIRGGTDALIIADVGQGSFEEINYEPRGRGGRNYGWRNREGAHDNITSAPPAFLPFTDPILEYTHAEGQSVSGGFVYRGTDWPAARGRYFFGDFVSGRVWSVALSIDGSGNATASGRVEHTAELSRNVSLGNISSFGLDAAGEMFIVSYGGSILRIASSAVPSAPTYLRIIP